MNGGESGRSLRVLVLSQYFWPESFRINELTKAMIEVGCSVTVLTGQPNYPDGIIFSGYRPLRLGVERHPDGYKIYRVPLVPRGRATPQRLIANYVSFVLSAAVFGPWLLRKSSFDVVFVYAPSPILQVLPAIVIKWLRKAPLITWVQDLWPQSLLATGFVRNASVLNAVEHLVRWIYRRNDLLLGQSHSFVSAIRELSASTPVEYFPNPGEGAQARAIGMCEPALHLEPGFNVVFAGNLGTVQALETALDAAELLRHAEGIRFVLIGSGSRSDWLRTEIARRALTNVLMPGRFPADEMPAILAQASVLLVSLIRSPSMSQTIPAKVQAYLAAGRPIIAAMDGEGARVILDAGAGLSVPAGAARELADAVLKLRSLPISELNAMGASGREYYEEHFAPEALARKLVAFFRDTLARSGRRRISQADA